MPNALRRRIICCSEESASDPESQRFGVGTGMRVLDFRRRQKIVIRRLAARVKVFQSVKIG